MPKSDFITTHVLNIIFRLLGSSDLNTIYTFQMRIKYLSLNTIYVPTLLLVISN